MVTAPPDAFEELLLPAVVTVPELLRRGRVRTALDELHRARRGSDGPGRDVMGDADEAATVAALLVECHVAQGDLPAALLLEPGLAAAGDHAWAHQARGELAAALGDHETALERFRAVPGGRRLDESALPWRAGAALAHLRLGARADALALAHEQHAAALAHGTAYDVALALRVLAATDATIDVATQRVPRLRTALACLDGVEAGRLRAQVGTDLAGLLVLEGRHDQALGLLRDAETYASREDLWPLQSRVRRLLERMGEAPRRDEAETLAVLTAAERRVARHVIEGMTNKQVAEQLAVTVKAVEGHLSKVYRKLGLSSRVALVASFDGR